MLRDQVPQANNAQLSVPSQHSVTVLLQFIDDTIAGFKKYIFVTEPVEDENAITYHLANYFNSELNAQKEGFSPYEFSFVKNPPQQGSRRETDLGVVILNRTSPSFTIIEFEAKRLSRSSNNSEYVFGDRGGIERFKRKHHAGRFETCGMFAYVQSYETHEWIQKINNWIKDLAVKNEDGLNWADKAELLVSLSDFGTVVKCTSTSIRVDDSKLQIYHYFLDLKNQQ